MPKSFAGERFRDAANCPRCGIRLVAMGGEMRCQVCGPVKHLTRGVREEFPQRVAPGPIAVSMDDFAPKSQPPRQQTPGAGVLQSNVAPKHDVPAAPGLGTHPPDPASRTPAGG